MYTRSPIETYTSILQMMIKAKQKENALSFKQNHQSQTLDHRIKVTRNLFYHRINMFSRPGTSLNNLQPLPSRNSHLNKSDNLKIHSNSNQKSQVSPKQSSSQDQVSYIQKKILNEKVIKDTSSNYTKSYLLNTLKHRINKQPTKNTQESLSSSFHNYQSVKLLTSLLPAQSVQSPGNISQNSFVKDKNKSCINKQNNQQNSKQNLYSSSEDQWNKSHQNNTPKDPEQFLKQTNNLIKKIQQNSFQNNILRKSSLMDNSMQYLHLQTCFSQELTSYRHKSNDPEQFLKLILKMDHCEKGFNKSESKQIFSQLYHIIFDIIRNFKEQLIAKDSHISKENDSISTLQHELKLQKLKFEESTRQHSNQLKSLNCLLETYQKDILEIQASREAYSLIIKALEQKGIDIQQLYEEKSNSSISIDVNPFLEQQKSTKPACLSLNLQGLGSAKIKEFHDEVYAKINEFSESWRKQALAEKRF